MNIKVGLATKLGAIFAVLAALPPFAMQIVALIENTSTHFTEANKLSLISAAAIAGVTIIGRMLQAVAHAWQGKEA